MNIEEPSPMITEARAKVEAGRMALMEAEEGIRILQAADALTDAQRRQFERAKERLEKIDKAVNHTG